LRIVINHVAGVLINGKAPDPAWVGGMQKAAENPNVYCKVSGLASATRLTPAPANVSFYVPTLDVLWKAFGEDRLIYGSDWPVCSRFAEYRNVLRVVRTYFGAKGKSAADKYFSNNAKAAYKWIERP
jgi:L-fuconolactonase